jgi:hypothetical protein
MVQQIMRVVTKILLLLAVMKCVTPSQWPDNSMAGIRVRVRIGARIKVRRSLGRQVGFD